jgi:hypothetical protein
MPLSTPDGQKRLAELACGGRPLLLDLTDGGTVAKAAAWAPRADVVTARPQPSADPAFTALLLRPDSYAAWATSAAEPDTAAPAALRAAGERWFGVG